MARCFYAMPLDLSEARQLAQGDVALQSFGWMRLEANRGWGCWFGDFGNFVVSLLGFAFYF